ncbi:hypothetical protein BP5796_12934 [Coleophoma crateriformis]|uniref:Uncharacterized protein n=1 Tax=Coleophoma crateriformis TaxID=565419 RepID=A0A3D8Q5A7_9HELO|nr:hypothetical protein BP5796_12934 [Coleophoma crateriformis]
MLSQDRAISDFLAAVVVSPWAFGGTVTTQAACVSLALLITVAMTKGIRGIRSGNLDVHRVWMLRTWAYAGSILTMRPINILLHVMVRVFQPNKFQTVSTCEQLASIYDSISPPSNEMISHYPMCLDDTTNKTLVVVLARLSRSRPDQTSALTTLTFGAALWAGTLINFVLIEWYLQATKDETKRLRMVRMNKPPGKERDEKSL